MKVETTGERLKEERERLGISAAKMAEYGGVGRAVQYNYEKNIRKPDTDYLARVAAVGVDILYVITGKRTPTASDTLSEDEARVVKNYKAATAEDQQAAQTLLNSLAKRGKEAA